MEKSAGELQEEGRKIAAWGGFVYRVHPSQVATMVEYQIPHIVIEQMPPVAEHSTSDGGKPTE